MGPPGHLGLGFAAKRVAPKLPLWLLLLASELLDLLCFVFMAAGMERTAITTVGLVQGITIVSPGTVPWSHGLFITVIWSMVAAAITYIFMQDQRSSIVIGLLVFSHWILDFVVHLPDLPLFFDASPLLGLGLWGSGPGLVISGILEIVVLFGGIVVYLRWKKTTA